MSFAYMPLYTGDYMRDTRHLTPEEHGCYLLLLAYYWDQKGPVPLDERRICGIVNARGGGEIESLRRVLAEFFILMEDGYYNPRMQKEIEKAEAISGKRRVAGLARHGLAVPVKVNPGQRLRSARMSEARKKGSHTKDEWAALVDFHGDACCKCGAHETMVVKDHIVPVHGGGSDAIENIQPLCYRCNHAKGTADSTDYRREGWKQHVLANAGCLLARGTTPTPNPNPIPTLNQEKTTPPPAATSSPAAPPVGVDAQVWRDWLALRKTKRAPVTPTALRQVQREADKAGLPLEKALEVCCNRGWTGFRAEWVEQARGKDIDFDKLIREIESEKGTT